MTTRKDADPAALERLKSLSESAQGNRLAPAEEDEAAKLLSEILTTGKAGTTTVAELAPSLPWSVAVKGVVEGWPELKPLARKQFIAALEAQNSENGRRCRLSLARALSGHDAEAAARLAGAVCAEMRSENGTVALRDRQTFFNVFIGKGKPWLTHFAVLQDWKDEDATALVDCAVQTCFLGSCAPFTQLALARWIASVGHFEKLSPASLEAIGKAAKRWVPKLKRELAEAVPELPPVLAEALQPPSAPVEEPAAVERPARREPRKPEPRAPAQRTEGRFDLRQTLRQIEAHVDSLTRELQQAKSADRRDDFDRSRRRSRSARQDGEPGTITSEEQEALQRHNQRLEERLAELQHQLEEITSHHEDVAASRMAAGEAADPGAELKALLGLKLRGDFEEFQALRGESATEVLRQHYREMLDHVFTILQGEGVELTDPERR